MKYKILLVLCLILFSVIAATLVPHTYKECEISKGLTFSKLLCLQTAGLL